MLVSIYSRTANCFGIVYVNRNETIATNNAIEFMKCFPHSGFAADLVTCGEQMRGVQAHAQTLRFAHVRDNVREMLEPMADARTLAGRNLECDFRLYFWNFPKHLVD